MHCNFYEVFDERFEVDRFVSLVDIEKFGKGSDRHRSSGEDEDPIFSI